MLATYTVEERSLLAKVCRFALLRCETAGHLSKFYSNLICHCNDNVPSLKSLAIMASTKLDKGGLCRNMPDFAQHQELTIYGGQFELANLPQDVATEISSLEQILNPYHPTM